MPRTTCDECGMQCLTGVCGILCVGHLVCLACGALQAVCVTCGVCGIKLLWHVACAASGVFQVLCLACHVYVESVAGGI